MIEIMALCLMVPTPCIKVKLRRAERFKCADVYLHTLGSLCTVAKSFQRAQNSFLINTLLTYWNICYYLQRRRRRRKRKRGRRSRKGDTTVAYNGGTLSSKKNKP
jgi:hypothetical protein